jgi:hypothetical protein
MTRQTFPKLGAKASDLTFGERNMRSAIIGAMLATSACADVPPKLSGPDACGAPDLQHLVGESEDVLAAMTFAAGRLRVIHPRTAITQDYSPDRLNITIDAEGRITRVHCG